LGIVTENYHSSDHVKGPWQLPERVLRAVEGQQRIVQNRIELFVSFLPDQTKPCELIRLPGMGLGGVDATFDICIGKIVPAGDHNASVWLDGPLLFAGLFGQLPGIGPVLTTAQQFCEPISLLGRALFITKLAEFRYRLDIIQR
jgi:hypothetical protein